MEESDGGETELRGRHEGEVAGGREGGRERSAV